MVLVPRHLVHDGLVGLDRGHDPLGPVLPPLAGHVAESRGVGIGHRPGKCGRLQCWTTDGISARSSTQRDSPAGVTKVNRPIPGQIWVVRFRLARFDFGQGSVSGSRVLRCRVKMGV